MDIRIVELLTGDSAKLNFFSIALIGGFGRNSFSKFPTVAEFIDEPSRNVSGKPRIN